MRWIEELEQANSKQGAEARSWTKELEQ